MRNYYVLLELNLVIHLPLIVQLIRTIPLLSGLGNLLIITYGYVTWVLNFVRNIVKDTIVGISAKT